MWKALLLCLLAFVAAEHQDSGAWRRNTDYTYSVNTQTLTAIPKLKNQWVGVFTKADLTIRQVSKDKLIGKLYNGQQSEFHDALHANDPTQYKPANELQYKPMEMNTKPFEIRMENGVIRSIAVDKDMTNIELNRVKSILSQLQVDIQARNAINDERNHFPQNFDAQEKGNQAAYKTMEPTVTGKCETNYDITRVPRSVAIQQDYFPALTFLRKDDFIYEVMKSKNYSNCEQTVGYHFGVSALNEWKPNTNVMGSLSKSSVSRVLITGHYDKYMIQSSATTNRVVKASADANTQQDSMVVSQVNLTLTGYWEDESARNERLENLVDAGNLVYSYNLPSNKQNENRPMNDNSSESQEDDEIDSAERSMMSESDLLEHPNMRHQYNQPKNSRSPRSIRNNNRRNQNQEQNEWADDDEQENKKSHKQPKPTLKNAPENPMNFISVGNQGQEFNAKHATEQMVSEIVEDLQDPNELPKKQTLRKFNILSNVLRTMNAQQIQETSERMINNNADEKNQQSQKKARKVYTDALVSAGTGPAANEIMRLIEEQKIRGEEAAELIAQLPSNLRLPTEEMQKRFFEFVKHHAVKNQENVNTAAGIAFTTYLYRAQVNKQDTNKFYPVETYEQLTKNTDKFVQKEVIPYFSELLEQAVRNKDAPRTLYAIRALGNLAHQDIPKQFEKYFKGAVEMTEFERLTMVLALDKYAVAHPESAKSILNQLFQNKGETSEIRSAALFQLMRTNPSASMLQRIAEETNTEENRDVRSAARSAIESASRLKSPQQAELARNAKAALNLLKPEELGMQYSRTNLHDYVVREMDASYQNQRSYLAEKSSFIPNGILSKTISNIGGFKTMSEYQAIVSSVEKLVDSLRSTIKPTKLNKRDQSNDDETVIAENWNEDQATLTADKIIRLLKLQQGQNKPLEGQLLVDALYGDRFIAFDEHTLKQLAQKLKKEANELRNGRNVNYSKMFNTNELTMSFPLETGLPFQYYYRQTSLVQVDGHVRVEIESNNNERHQRNENDDENDNNEIRVPEQIKLDAKLQAVYSTVQENTMTFVCPSTRQIYSGGYDKNHQLYAPLRVISEIDTRKQEVKTEIKPLNENKQYKLLQIGSWPFTARKSMSDLRPSPLSKHTKNLNQRPLRKTSMSFGEKETGFAFNIEGTQEKDSNQIMNVWNELRKHDLTSLFMLGKLNASPQQFSLNVILDGEKSSAKMAKFTLTYKNDKANNADEQNDREQQQQQKRDEQAYNKHPRARGQSPNGDNENLAISEFVKPNSQPRREQLMRNAAQDMKVATKTDVMDIGVEFIGEKKHEYIATIARASSQAEGKARVLAFLQKSQDSKQSKNIYLQVDAKYEGATENQQNANENRPHADLKVTMTYARENKMDTLRAHVQLKQSRELNKEIRAQRDQQIAARKNAVDHIDVELDLKEVQEKKSLTSTAAELYDYIRYATCQNLNEDKQYEGHHDKLVFEVRLRNDMSSANITMKAVNMKSEWNGIPVSKMLRNIIVVPSSQSKFNLLKESVRNSIQYQDTCQIKSNKINTFDDAKIENVELDGTWHVAAQSMRRGQASESKWENQENRQKKLNDFVAVAVRNTEKNMNDDGENQAWTRKHQNANKDIEMAVILRQNANNQVVIMLRPGNEHSDNMPRLFVNGKEQKLSESQAKSIYANEYQREQLARIYIVKRNTLDQSKKDVKIETTIGNYEITYNGKEMQIQRDSLIRGNDGICGAHTGQQYNELKTPQNQLLRNEMEFVASWALIEDEHEHRALKRVQEKARNTEHPTEKIVYSNPIPSSKRAQNKWNDEQNEQNEYDQERNAQKNHRRQHQNNRKLQQSNQDESQSDMKLQTQYVEDDERICFSKRPLPVCTEGARARGHHYVSVDVHCRDINDSIARQYKSQIQRAYNVDMENRRINDKREFLVPKRCEQF